MNKSDIPAAVISIAERFKLPMSDDETCIKILMITAQPLADKMSGNTKVDAELVMAATERFNAALNELDSLRQGGGSK